jgi:hypothetical protein
VWVGRAELGNSGEFYEFTPALLSEPLLANKQTSIYQIQFLRLNVKSRSSSRMRKVDFTLQGKVYNDLEISGLEEKALLYQ